MTEEKKKKWIKGSAKKETPPADKEKPAKKKMRPAKEIRGKFYGSKD